MELRSLILSREGLAPAQPVAFVMAGQVAPQFLALAGGAIDEGVDGLEAVPCRSSTQIEVRKARKRAASSSSVPPEEGPGVRLWRHSSD
jgi:hypothetical protein